MLGRSNVLAWLAGATALGFCLAHSAHAAGDPVAGEKKFYTCYGCHGIVNYRNAYPDYNVPKLRHQNAAYIVAALHEYKNGDRPHPTMHAQASSLSDQDMEDIAAYLQGPEPVNPAGAPSGELPKQATPCTACHGVNGRGVAAALDPKPPILAGQYESYLIEALKAYHNRRRKNVVMNGMAQLLVTDEDIKAVAEYFSNQPSPLETPNPDNPPEGK
ncbi:MAG TPA: c-type cytochrome [Steroidobacteraceae bacterium]|nr:c-type cytochrome [Steroidobacteraceae bacterium]